MKIEKLNIKITSEKSLKLDKAISKMERLIDELNKREIPSKIILKINSEINALNAFAEPEKALTRKINKVYRKILRTLETKLKIVPKNHYRNLWMAIGISIIGIVFGSAFSNIGIGIPIGLAIGIAVGTNLDKKAAEEGKQLDVCPRY